MGLLTTITIHNDALHAFQKDPKGFGEAILKGIDLANMSYRSESVPFESYANYITVHPSRHADNETIYLHSGNTVTEIGNSNQWEQLCLQNKECATNFLNRAKQLLKWAKESLAKTNKQG